MLTPSMVMRPQWSSTSRKSATRRELFPAPVRPTTPTFSLASTESEKLWSTSGRPCGETGGEQCDDSGHRNMGIEQWASNNSNPWARDLIGKHDWRKAPRWGTNLPCVDQMGGDE